MRIRNLARHSRDRVTTYTTYFRRWAAKPETEDFSTLNDAVASLAYGEDGGYLAVEKITGPNGFVLEGSKLRDAMWDVIERNERSGKTK